MEELRSLMIDMPMYSSSFLVTMVELLQTYINTSQAVFKGAIFISDILSFIVPFLYRAQLSFRCTFCYW